MNSKKRFNLFYLIMILFFGIVIILSIMFPIRKIFLSKNDTLIENNLNSVSYSIDNYYIANKSLPNTLNDIQTKDEETKILIDKQLVQYTKQPMDSGDSSSLLGEEYDPDNFDVSAGLPKYTLCVNYKFSKDYNSTEDNYYDIYRSYPKTNSHPSGNVCYKLYVN